tara:strand:+ start:1673 stop:2197 length:525 start_codon:yes stop_codon:yes gene_type:complete
MRIVLIGYRACGKSTVGQLVADQLGWPLLDVDRGIEQQSGMTLKALYEEQGNARYREIEHQVATRMCERDPAVVSFGAGTIMQPANERLARKDSLVIYLELPAEELWRRMQADPHSATTRPNLSSGGMEEVVQMMEQRGPVYQRCADLKLDGRLAPQQLADQIVGKATSPQTDN